MGIKALYTIGYEGSELRDFLNTLVKLKVKTVVDVRELPLSRKKGFSKTPLTAALAALGIEYRHERALGCPPEIRARLREDGDYVRYFKSFNAYLARNGAVVEDAARDLKGNVALLCYERNAAECHRSSVADVIRDLFAVRPQHVAVA